MGAYPGCDDVLTRKVDLNPPYVRHLQYMQWILQQFEDTDQLAKTLDKLGIAYSLHKVVPFIGELQPDPV